MLNIFFLNYFRSNTYYKQRLAGFARYLATLNQYSEQDFNKVAIRLYIQAYCSCQQGYASVLSALLTIYAKDPAYYRHNIASFNSHLNDKMHTINKVFIMIFLLATAIALFLAVLLFPSEAQAYHHYHSSHSKQLFTIGGLFLLVGFLVAALVLGRAYAIHTLMKVEQQLYRGVTPAYGTRLSLNLETVRFPSRSSRRTVLSVEKRLDFILRNVPPYTINDNHVLSITQLFPYFNRNIKYTLSYDYHLIPQYVLPTFRTTEEVDKLLDYLGMRVKKSPHNYDSIFTAWD